MTNREIKFRAWHKEKKEWINPTFHGDIIVGNEICIVRDFKPQSGRYVFAKSREFMCGEFDEVLVSQFTGLKDKNGKEIYEGDLVRSAEMIDGNFVTRIIETSEVIFQGVSFQYKPNKKNYTVNPIGYEVEIIGNVYENPDLLPHD